MLWKFVASSSWRRAFDECIAEPGDLEVFQRIIIGFYCRLLAFVLISEDGKSPFTILDGRSLCHDFFIMVGPYVPQSIPY